MSTTRDLAHLLGRELGAPVEGHAVRLVRETAAEKVKEFVGP